MIRLAFSFILMLVLVAAAAGCKKNKPEPKPQAQKVQPARASAPEKDIQEEVKKIVNQEYSYNPRGRRDPFLSLVALSEKKPEKRKGASPIESYDIDQIKLMAIAWDKDRYYALIRLPDNKTYTIIKGMAIGLQGGKVESITPSAVLIREYVENYRGDITPKDTILKLHKGEE